MDDFPSKNMARGERRRARSTKLAKTKKIAKTLLFSFRSGTPHPDDKRDPLINDWSLKHVDNMKACSCHMCGNFRALYGETLQEKKFKLTENDYK